ncbi:hypothetical protein [Streptomyces sp. ISL-94]|uniref:hypothetical protein n=1 Tax=Streptomyces sp. ISL-94 TaxID=2819190 RepID=UPI001BE9338C|nr:hypothetical protein [Streptomyces sp. ISL-94]
MRRGAGGGAPILEPHRPCSRLPRCPTAPLTGALAGTDNPPLTYPVVYRAVSLWTVRDGEIVGAREYWTSPGQDPAPRWRAGYVEPLVAD